MKYVKEAGIIFGMSAAGEILNKLLPLPVPAGVYGLFLLLICLVTGLVKLEWLEATGNWLLDAMPIMFLPACVGIMESFGELRAVLIPFVVTAVVSTVLVIGVTGRVAQWIISRKRGGEER